MKTFAFICALIAVLGVSSADAAAVPNGNDYALEISEAATPADIKYVLSEGVGKQHFFRYLEVLAIKKGNNKGAPVIGLKTREPSSDMIVKFLVQKSVSLSKLLEAPETQVGDAVAVTGVIEKVDPKKKTIVLNPVIVRYKDRLAPKVGREMMEEVDDSAIIYSFTAGTRPVNVSKRDEDLIRNEKEMVEKLGKDGWANYLRAEIEKRNKAERKARDKMNIYKKK